MFYMFLQKIVEANPGETECICDAVFCHFHKFQPPQAD